MKRMVYNLTCIQIMQVYIPYNETHGMQPQVYTYNADIYT